MEFNTFINYTLDDAIMFFAAFSFIIWAFVVKRYRKRFFTIGKYKTRIRIKYLFIPIIAFVISYSVKNLYNSYLDYILQDNKIVTGEVDKINTSVKTPDSYSVVINNKVYTIDNSVFNKRNIKVGKKYKITCTNRTMIVLDIKD